MTVRLSRSTALILGVVLASCAPAKDTAPAAPVAITQAEIEKSTQDQVGALAAGDAAKSGAAYATDAVFISARGRIDSQAAITSFWTEALKTPGAAKNLKLELVKWGASGDLAYSLSRFTGGITAPSGYVLAASQRQADGSLKIVMQVSIPDPPKK